MHPLVPRRAGLGPRAALRRTGVRGTPMQVPMENMLEHAEKIRIMDDSVGHNVRLAGWQEGPAQIPQALTCHWLGSKSHGG